MYDDDFGEEEDWDAAEDNGAGDAEGADEQPKKKRKGDDKGPAVHPKCHTVELARMFSVLPVHVSSASMTVQLT